MSDGVFDLETLLKWKQEAKAAAQADPRLVTIDGKKHYIFLVTQQQHRTIERRKRRLAAKRAGRG